MTTIRVQDKSLPSPQLNHTLSRDVRYELSVENAGDEEQKQEVVNRQKQYETKREDSLAIELAYAQNLLLNSIKKDDDDLEEENQEQKDAKRKSF